MTVGEGKNYTTYANSTLILKATRVVLWVNGLTGGKFMTISILFDVEALKC